jgi:carboxylesterase type B
VRPRLAPAQSEDCLYINVRTPDSSLWDADAAKPSKLLPVFVWIHGGDHQDGAGMVHVIHTASGKALMQLCCTVKALTTICTQMY